MSGVRRITPEEYDQGWYVMADGVHAHIFRSDVLRKFPQAAAEFCDDCNALVVKISDLAELEEKK